MHQENAAKGSVEPLGFDAAFFFRLKEVDRGDRPLGESICRIEASVIRPFLLFASRIARAILEHTGTDLLRLKLPFAKFLLFAYI